jgi:hypothetical protein
MSCQNRSTDSQRPSHELQPSEQTDAASSVPVPPPKKCQRPSDSCLLGSLLFFWCPKAIGSDNNGLPSSRQKEAKQSRGVSSSADLMAVVRVRTSRPNGCTKHELVGQNKSPLWVASSWLSLVGWLPFWVSGNHPKWH